MLARLCLAALATAALASPRGGAPVMGWSGYNAFMQNSGHCDKAGAGGYNETTFIATADALVSQGLAKLGYVYLNLDDCWIAEKRTADGKLAADPTRFPHGMAWLAEQAHSRGLKLGLYAAASLETCRNFPGSQGFEKVDAETFVGWGADFVKLDSCGGFLAHGSESWKAQYGAWADALSAAPRRVTFSCSWPTYFSLCAAKVAPEEWESLCGPLPWADNFLSDKCDMWRYGNDLRPWWGVGPTGPTGRPGFGGAGVGDVIDFASSAMARMYGALTARGAVNDPDFLVVGCPTDRGCEQGFAPIGGMKPLSQVEQRSQMSVWCVWGAPLILGSDVRALPSWALEILSNEDAIAINQDEMAAAPRLLGKAEGGVQVWARALAGGEAAVAVVNMNGTATLSGGFDLAAALPGAAAACVLDVWSGARAPHSKAFAARLAPHEAALLRLRAGECRAE